MCGRGRQTAPSAQAVVEALQIPAIFRAGPQVAQAPSDDDVEDEYSPFNNGAPGRSAPIALEGPSEEPATVTLARWGMVPAYQSPNTPPDFWKMFNARDDNLANVHGRLLNSHRCVIPFSGFYEWENRIELGKKRKLPYYLSSKDGTQIHMAGLWDTWKNKDGKTIRSFSIITVQPSEDIKWLHNRMPAILQGPEEVRLWLDATKPFASVKSLIRPFKVGGLQWWPVTENIGKLGYQAEDCAKPVELVKGNKSITSFFAKKPKPEASGTETCDETENPEGAAKKTSDTTEQNLEGNKRVKVEVNSE
jgi:putative SOS response-associated peptidase YedK